jgi:hypothetical protein
MDIHIRHVEIKIAVLFGSFKKRIAQIKGMNSSMVLIKMMPP